MLIVSGFRDFYDSAMGLGIDKTVVYYRTTSPSLPVFSVTEPTLCSLLRSLPQRRASPDSLVRSAVLLICGEAIPLIQIEIDGKINNFYSSDKAITFIHGKNIGLNRHYYFWRSHHDVSSAKGIRIFFETKDFLPLTKLHYLNRCPVILCREGSVTLNPNLRELGYQTQKDPYTLFQSIYMFISGVLGTPEKEPRPISDEIKAANHGFDDKYSFKNLPGKKRGRNK